jgi:hypothetical protein
MILEESPYRLLVEGSDDQHSVLHLMARHGFDWNDSSAPRPHVLSAGSVDRLLESLPVTLKSHQRVGVLVDADASPASRWAQLRDRALRAGVRLPETPEPEGTIISGPLPGSRIGFWLMPDNSAPGTLEVFLGKLVPESDSTWAWANEAAREARQRGARCREIDRPKSRLHTWLAWQERPGIPFGIALQAQVFRHDSEDALRFVAWFNRLFVDA